MTSVAISRGGQSGDTPALLVSGSKDCTIKVWDIQTGRLRHSEDKTVKVWDIQTGILRRTLEGHSSKVTSVAICRDGKIIVSGSRDKTIRVWGLTKD